MQTILLFSSLDHLSLEHCEINFETAADVHSVITGSEEGNVFRLDYNIRTDENWSVVFFRYCFIKNGNKKEGTYLSDGKGHWTLEGKRLEAFDDCIDIDIPLTPFTNSLPINRLKMDVGSSHLIHVLYFDFMQGQFKKVQQEYTRRSPLIYHYENVPNDFEADITVDGEGFVRDYPGLFSRCLF